MLLTFWRTCLEFGGRRTHIICKFTQLSFMYSRCMLKLANINFVECKQEILGRIWKMCNLCNKFIIIEASVPFLRLRLHWQCKMIK